MGNLLGLFLFLVVERRNEMQQKNIVFTHTRPTLTLAFVLIGTLTLMTSTGCAFS